ncbi:MAG: lasso peptide isopeptide bond-forming cyclase [Caldilineaceae bacterium]
MFRDSKPVEPTELEWMIATLNHRGADGAGIWTQGSVGLGAQRLWITPESCHERQPWHDPISSHTIVADARLDNREELYDLVDAGDQPFATLTDALLILRAYEKWGERCVEKLLGDFAFAIWDEHRQRLFCARDHFGVRPLYYYLSAQACIFATELKAILRWPQVPQQLNEVRVADYLYFGDYDATSTFYQQIMRLPPSHTLSVSRDGASLQQYWHLDPDNEVRLRSDAAYTERLYDLFTEAVRCRLRSAFPVGAMLSGGLDSSSIACVAHNLLSATGKQRLFTFSALHDKVPESDERYFIHAVLAQGDFTPLYLDADEVSPWVDLERVLWHQDEACRAGNLYANWCLYALAKQQGVRVILDGFDGDSTISHGIGLLTELARAGRWFALSREVIAYTRKTDKPWGPPLWAWVQQYGLKPLLAKSLIRKGVSGVKRALIGQPPGHPIPGKPRALTGATLNANFMRRLGIEERYHKRLPAPRTDREMQYQRLSDPGMPYTLELLNKSAGAHSLEVRFPFWDKRLVEFCLAVPPEQKLHHGWTRMMMRRAMSGVLPPAVQWRGAKANMHPSFARNLLTFEQARLEQIIYKNCAVIEPYVDLLLLQKAYARYRAGQATEYEINAIWRTISLAVWLQHAGLSA